MDFSGGIVHSVLHWASELFLGKCLWKFSLQKYDNIEDEFLGDRGEWLLA